MVVLKWYRFFIDKQIIRVSKLPQKSYKKHTFLKISKPNEK